ncbi:MAG: deoxyribose-phosphate aldolase [Anaerolineales bacterium]
MPIDERPVTEWVAHIRPTVEATLQNLPKGMPILRAEQAMLPGIPEGERITHLIDHTLLRTEYTPADVDRVCEEGLKYGFASVCTNPIYVPQVVRRLQGSNTLPASIVGFLFGAEFPSIKVEQAKKLIEAGVREMDMVQAVGLLKAGRYAEVARDIQGVVDVCHRSGVLLKVILEVGLLEQDEKIAGALIAQHVGADYVKTCTGFTQGEATADDIRLLRSIVGNDMGVKAAGGIRSYEKAIELIRAGASRLGATQSVQIAEEARKIS